MYLSWGADAPKMEDHAMGRIEREHPLAIRWFHLVNFPVLAVMVWSGLLIYWAERGYDWYSGH